MAQQIEDRRVDDAHWRLALDEVVATDHRERRIIGRWAAAGVIVLALVVGLAQLGLLGPRLSSPGGGGDATGRPANGIVTGTVEVALHNDAPITASVDRLGSTIRGVHLEAPVAELQLPGNADITVRAPFTIDCSSVPPELVGRDGAPSYDAATSRRYPLVTRARGRVLGVPVWRDVEIDGSALLVVVSQVCSTATTH